MLKFGIISDIKPGFAKVSFDENEIVTDWLPVLVRKSLTQKESWQLEVNEHVVCLMDEECTDGVILGAIPSEADAPDAGEAAGKFRKLFSDGTLIEYDKAAHKLTVDVKGSLEAKTTGQASVEATTTLKGKAGITAEIEAPVINLKGNVVVTGTLSAGAISTTIGGGGTGKLEIAGDIAATGKIEATGEVKSGLISLSTHIHPGVQTGPGVTGLPQ